MTGQTRIVYLIRHRPTGTYIEAPKGKSGRGGSRSGLVQLDGPTRVRIFWTERSAKIALTYWLMGEFRRCMVCQGPDFIYEEELDVDPVPERVREDMEVVALSLSEIEVP